MFLDYPKIFAKKADTVKVRALKNIIVQDSKGIAKPLSRGDEIEVKASDVFDAGDIERVDPAKAKVDAIQDPTPQRPDPAPMPSEWEQLPDCFSKWWNINEQFRAAHQHIEDIKATRLKTFGTEIPISFSDDTGNVIVNRLTFGKPNEGVVYDRKIFNVTDPEVRQLETFIFNAEESAKDYLERLRETKALDLQRAYLDCGFHRLRVCEQLDEVILETQKIGFEIFKLRIGALGLADGHTRRLYSGSADAVKYHSMDSAYSGSKRSAGYDSHGILRVYVEEPVTSTAQISIREVERTKEAKKLLKQGREELAKIQKISA
ncbi:MAG: hypothetical protein AB8D78_01525 [Akkermansiaceae bacterium]